MGFRQDVFILKVFVVGDLDQALCEIKTVILKVPEIPIGTPSEKLP